MPLTTTLKRVLAAGLICFLSAAAWAQSTPDQTVKAVLQDVISDIKANPPKTQREAVGLIEKKVIPYFDFTRMTALAVGRSWRDATPNQRVALVREFHTLIVRTYSNTVQSYQNETMDVFPVAASEAAKGDTVVRTQVNRKGGPVRIDLSVRNNNGKWQVYDVTVAGVSIVMNFRETFNSEIKKGGIDGLIQSLTDKNRESEAALDK